VNELAPAKINLCLFLGPVREDGRHELVTLFESISLADELRLTVLGEGAEAERAYPGSPDEVVCPGVEGPNLVSAALDALRRHGWAGPPVRIEIDKRIPVAAGLGGGSADAAAALRLAQALSPSHAPSFDVIAHISRELGADVPSQLRPGLSLGTGAGEEVDRLQPLARHAVVIVPQPFPLSTADVYREADRLELPRAPEELANLRRSVAAAAVPGAVLPDELLVNDLGPAAISLAPSVEEALRDVRQAGSDHALVCGSGPTVMGIYWGEQAERRAAEGAERLRSTYSQAVSTTPDLASQ
jgi:4-diphosphocytidyl-2-C-methyl-D-erythritol kinase